jgi:hypothetical protein
VTGEQVIFPIAGASRRRAGQLQRGLSALQDWHASAGQSQLS